MKVGTIIQNKFDGEYYVVRGYHCGDLLLEKIDKTTNQYNVGDAEHQEYEIVFEVG